MGTNYYIASEPCPHCGHAGERIHIGKSSAGWCFALRIYPDEGINTLEDWQRFWEGKTIVDEYGDEVEPGVMLSKITERGREPRWEEKPPCYPNWAAFHRENWSEPGPNGLLRRQIRKYCIGHGPGTYDYILGEYS